MKTNNHVDNYLIEIKDKNEKLNEIVEILDTYVSSLKLMGSDREVTISIKEQEIGQEKIYTVIGSNYRINVDSQNRVEFIYSITNSESLQRVEEIKKILSENKIEFELFNRSSGSYSKFIFSNFSIKLFNEIEKINFLLHNLEVE